MAENEVEKFEERIMGKRVILIVLDSVGIGGAKDAADFGDEGSHTLAACSKDSAFSISNMKRIGMDCIEGALPYDQRASNGLGAWARLEEASKGKDTTIGHWEIMGLVQNNRFRHIRMVFHRRSSRLSRRRPVAKYSATFLTPARK